MNVIQSDPMIRLRAPESDLVLLPTPGKTQKSSNVLLTIKTLDLIPEEMVFWRAEISPPLNDGPASPGVVHVAPHARVGAVQGHGVQSGFGVAAGEDVLAVALC